MKKRSRRRSFAAGILMGSALILVGDQVCRVPRETTPSPEPAVAAGS